jgi:DNA-binding response OmpR family regulator
MHSHTVLIIDDDAEVADSIGMFLEGKGYQVQKAYDVTEETFDLIVKDPPDLIILDIVLPTMDGIDALKRLKSTPSTRNIPVIICSVVRRKQRVVEGLDAGAADYLTKPFEVEELFARVESVLIAHTLGEQTRENENLETLRQLAATVADEIQGPLAEIRRHVESLLASPNMADTENNRLVESVALSVDQIERLLRRFRGGPASPQTD